MTMTESPPSEAAESTEPVAATPGAGLYDALTTSDHKAIGRIWLRLGLLLLLGGRLSFALSELRQGANHRLIRLGQ